MQSDQNDTLTPGIYERLIDVELAQALEAHPELKPILGKLDDEDAPHTYGQFLFHVISTALRQKRPPERLTLVNRLIELLSATDGLEYAKRYALIQTVEPILLGLQTAEHLEPPPRPLTPLTTSSLLTGRRGDPQLEHELRKEMATADRVDVLVSFIKWSGLRLLIPALEKLAARKIPVRILTTSYMGASDPEAIEWLARQSGFSVKISYDTKRTRLHAKAYHFYRRSGFSAAYIGSANMSRAAMTSGLEWTVKVTEVDLAHILNGFTAEFSSYWESPEFEAFDLSQSSRLRAAISEAQSSDTQSEPRFFADIIPHPFQERILEALSIARANGRSRNLVVSATGTGKTVVAAFDYSRYGRAESENTESNQSAMPTLLFVAHRKEILEQARDCFRSVLRDANFGELWVDGIKPNQGTHVFASVQSLATERTALTFSADHFRFIIVDEVHHGAAASYRPIFDNYLPEVLLGLTATPERMDGSSILPDFGGEFAAEIRLPEALEEKLLCPFHYFGVTDPISLADERFWRNGRYDAAALTEVYTGDDIRARQRVDFIVASIRRYQPNLTHVRAVGFCATVAHARYMAAAFNQLDLVSAVIVGDTPSSERQHLVRDFRNGQIPFLFTVDVFSEGVDVPEINLVMFLRPTESLTVFLQQLGRGLRHSPKKDSLTVLDFIGQNHHRYRIDRKFAALLTRNRKRMDWEIESDFPHLPPGCSLQLERVAREHVLTNIKESLRNFKTLVTESLATFSRDHGCEPTFGNFVRSTEISPLELLRSRTWSEWRAVASGQPLPDDPDLKECRQALRRAVLRTDQRVLEQLESFAQNDRVEETAALRTEDTTLLHYLLWGKKASEVGVVTIEESLAKWHRNKSACLDLSEIVQWRRQNSAYSNRPADLPFPCNLKLHAAYGSPEIKAALGLNSIDRSGPTGVGVFHAEKVRCYVHLITFRKVEKDFSPTTQYRDYPISRTQLHWESQSTTTQISATGLNYLHFKERGYTILFFARLDKRIENETAPFVFLGQAKNLLSAEGNRPIAMVWELTTPMPAALFEDARAV